MHDSLKILAVDDDPSVLDVFSGYFAGSQDIEVFTASSGATGLDVFKNQRPDFCFTDLAMPGMDGIDLSKRILEIDDTVPIVIMTGYPSMEATINALQAGVVDFMVKPFKIKEVQFIIDKVLAQKDLMVENLLLKSEVARKQEMEALNQELGAKVEELEKLNLILRKVDWKQDSGDLFNQLTAISCEIADADQCFFHILDDLSGALHLLSMHAGDGSAPMEEAPPAIEALAHQALAQGSQAHWTAREAGEAAGGLHSAASIPFAIKDKPMGGLTVGLARPGRTVGEEDLRRLNFLSRRAALVVENTALYDNLCQNLFATLYAFVEAIEARDPYTKQHSVRVAEISVAVGAHMGCTPRDLDLLDFAGRLHDIGKIGVRDNILLKNGRLDDEEFRIIKTHPAIGASIVGHLGLMAEETRIILHHHERWDGNGYPHGLAGGDIPKLARIMAVADTFDAMTSDRAYRRRLDDSVAFDTVKKNAGSQFDPAVSKAFLELAAQGIIKGPAS